MKILHRHRTPALNLGSLNWIWTLSPDEDQSLDLDVIHLGRDLCSPSDVVDSCFCSIHCYSESSDWLVRAPVMCHWVSKAYVRCGQCFVKSCRSLFRVGPGHTSSPLVHLLPHSPFYFSLSFIGFTYFFLLSIPSLSTRIVPLRFQNGGRRWRPNLGFTFVCSFSALTLLVGSFDP